METRPTPRKPVEPALRPGAHAPSFVTGLRNLPAGLRKRQSVADAPQAHKIPRVERFGLLFSPARESGRRVRAELRAS
jgi:hypothetical protein